MICVFLPMLVSYKCIMHICISPLLAIYIYIAAPISSCRQLLLTVFISSSEENIPLYMIYRHDNIFGVTLIFVQYCILTCFMGTKINERIREGDVNTLLSLIIEHT